jgi:hypothetical protein
MAHVFCTQCGFKIIYNHAKPNFCSKCGNSTNVVTAAQFSDETPTFDARISRQSIEAISEDETDADHVPEIGRLQVEIEASTNSTFSLGTLFGQNAPPSRSRRRNTTIDDFIDEKKSNKNI